MKILQSYRRIVHNGEWMHVPKTNFIWSIALQKKKSSWDFPFKAYFLFWKGTIYICFVYWFLLLQFWLVQTGGHNGFSLLSKAKSMKFKLSSFSLLDMYPIISKYSSIVCLSIYMHISHITWPLYQEDFGLNILAC